MSIRAMFENLHDIKLFTSIYQSGSLSQTAHDLAITPGMVSKKLAQLEKDLGLRLFQRTTRKVQPTEEGKRLYSQAMSLFEIIEGYENEWAGHSEVKGQLNISASASFARIYLMPLISDFLKLYPKIQIKLDLSDRIIDIVDEGIDVAIRISQMTDSSLIAKRIGSGTRLLCASRSYLEGRPPILTPSDLAKHNCLVLNEKQLWDFDSDSKIISQRVSGSFQSNYGEANMQCIREGLGIGIASYWHAKEDLEEKRLEVVLPKFKLANDPSIYAVYPSKKFVPLRTKLFVDFLAAKLKVPELRKR